jgi:hypothetical protein
MMLGNPIGYGVAMRMGRTLPAFEIVHAWRAESDMGAAGAASLAPALARMTDLTSLSLCCTRGQRHVTAMCRDLLCVQLVLLLLRGWRRWYLRSEGSSWWRSTSHVRVCLGDVLPLRIVLNRTGDTRVAA